MPTPRMPKEQAEHAIALVEKRLKSGAKPLNMFGPGLSAVELAAQDAVNEGIVNTLAAFRSRLRAAKDLYGVEPDWSLYSPSRYNQPVPRAVIIPCAPPDPAASVPNGERELVLVIPDLHQDPRHEDRIDVLRWIGRLGAERNVPRVIQLGDWGTFDSVSSHDRNETRRGRVKPSVRADLDNLAESLAAWRDGAGTTWKPKLHVTLGNHENRLETFENYHPESQGMFANERDQTFARYGWRTKPYGELMYVQGVAFTHHPTNGAGKAYGGKTGAQRAANEVACSIVGGHTHRLQHHTAGKIGPIEAVDIIEAGCALPWGQVEAYAMHSITGWWHGVGILACMGGRVMSAEWIDMLAIRDRYSDAGG